MHERLGSIQFRLDLKLMVGAKVELGIGRTNPQFPIHPSIALPFSAIPVAKRPLVDVGLGHIPVIFFPFLQR